MLFKPKGPKTVTENPERPERAETPNSSKTLMPRLLVEAVEPLQWLAVG
jgi:hypothetical protein